jgi:5-methylcytosine-specific restriction enzyme subunit McrC
VTRRVISLREWQSDHRETDLALTEADRRLAQALSEGEGRLRITQLSDSVRFDASAWVGVVRLAGVEVRVVPKLVGENLGVLRMLEYSSGLGALARLESARTLATDNDGSLVDLLALLLAEAALLIAKQGVLSDYVTREDGLPRLRGRLLACEQATKRFGQLQMLECRFDELETDVVENQLLAAGLAIAKRVATDSQVRRLAGRASAVFTEVADASAVTYETPELEYTRRNEHYRAPHVIARMFLRNLAVNDLYAPGSGESFAFLLDMNRLFEDFVTKLLAQLFIGTDVRVRPQARDRTLIHDARTGRPYAAVIPDILLERMRGPTLRVPVDAKYKLYDDRKIDQADIYQTFFYAWAYASREADDDARAFILYPGTQASTGEHLVARAADGSAGATIRAVPVDVPALLSALSNGTSIAIPEISDTLLAEWPGSAFATT